MSIADAQPRTIRGYFVLDSLRSTLLYWVSVVLVVATVFIPRLPPLADYPQHLALADLVRRLMDPAAPEHADYWVSFFTYNGLFHFLTSRLGVILPMELAGKVVVALALGGLGAGVLALLRTLGRPPGYALLFVPAIFSFSVAWGFINHALCLALATFALVFIVRALLRPSFKAGIITLALGLLCGFAHVLVMAVLCILAVAIAPELAWRSVRGSTTARRLGRAIFRAFCALAPLLGGGVHCILVFREQYGWDPRSYTDATMEGSAPPLWKKALLFGNYATGTHWDKSDTVLVWLVVAVLVFVAVVGRRQRRDGVERPGPAPVYGPLVASLLAYFAVPMVFVGTHLVFPRLAQVVLLTAVLTVPPLVGHAGHRVRKWAQVLAVVAGLNLCGHAVSHAIETNPASRVIDALPADRRVSSVVYDAAGATFPLSSLVHVAAYYGARQHGEWAFNFARFASVPVHFKSAQPPWPRKGWEFKPRDYNPRCNYARSYDVVIVGMPRRKARANEREVRWTIFRQDADIPRLIARDGRFWAFDTAGIPSDGTF